MLNDLIEETKAFNPINFKKVFRLLYENQQQLDCRLNNQYLLIVELQSKIKYLEFQLEKHNKRYYYEKYEE